MKTIIALMIVFLAWSAVLSLPEEPPTLNEYILEQTIVNSINTFREALAKHDPLHINNKELSFLGRYALVRNFSAQGFSNFLVSHIYVSGFLTCTFELVIEAPKIVIAAEHWEVDSAFFYGNGSARATVKAFTITLTATFNPLAMFIKELNLTPSIGDVKITITGVNNNEESSLEFSNNANQFFNDVVNNDTNFHQTASSILQTIIQNIFSY